MSAAKSSKKSGRRSERKKAAPTGVSFEDVCILASRFPGVERGISYGTPSLKVRGKFLLRLKEDGESVAIKVPMDDRDVLLDVDPRVFFITDHYRGYPAILFRLAEMGANQLEDLLERAWRFVASPRLVAAHDSVTRRPTPRRGGRR